MTISKVTQLLIGIVFPTILLADTCLRGDCENGGGVMSDNDGLYIGTFENGNKMGWATIQNKQGMYFGEVKDGKRDGMGTLLKESKIQEGRWRRGKLVEKGEVLPGSSLASGWLGNVCEEVGSTFLYSDGTFYVGGCREGEMQGRGVLAYHNQKITGNFTNGKLEGEATVYFQDGSRVTRTYRGGELIKEISLED